MSYPTLRIETDGQTATVRPVGDLTREDAPALDAELVRLHEERRTQITVDLAETDYVHKDCFGAINAGRRRAEMVDGYVRLANPRGLVERKINQYQIGEPFGLKGGEAPAEDVLRRAMRRAEGLDLGRELTPADLPRVPKRSASEAASLCVERIRK